MAGFKVPKTRSQKARAFAQLANLEYTADGAFAKQQLQQQQRKRLRSSQDTSRTQISPADARNKLKRIGLKNGGPETDRSPLLKPAQQVESECASSVPGVMSFVADTAESTAHKAEGITPRPAANSKMEGGRVAALRGRGGAEENKFISSAIEVEGVDVEDDEDDVIEVKSAEDEEMADVIVEEVQVTSVVEKEQGEKEISTLHKRGGPSEHAAKVKRRGRGRSKEVAGGRRNGEVATGAGANEKESARVVRSSPRLSSLQPMAGVGEAVKGRGRGWRAGEACEEEEDRGRRNNTAAADARRVGEAPGGDTAERDTSEKQEPERGSASHAAERDNNEHDNKAHDWLVEHRPSDHDRKMQERRDTVSGPQAERLTVTCKAELAGREAGLAAGESPENVRGMVSRAQGGHVREQHVGEDASPGGELSERGQGVQAQGLRTGEASLAANSVKEEGNGNWEGQRQQQQQQHPQQQEEKSGGALLAGGRFDDLQSVDESSGGFARTYERKGKRITSEEREGEGEEEVAEVLDARREGKRRRRSTGKGEERETRSRKEGRVGQRRVGSSVLSSAKRHEDKERKEDPEGEGETDVERRKSTGGIQVKRGGGMLARRGKRGEGGGDQRGRENVTEEVVAGLKERGREADARGRGKSRSSMLQKGVLPSER